ncbi:hypothetical protein [Marinicella gelatinilytica]|uniref:hypothetical protein n=1 Tax=Marinicella gelatinilytica TaxID=2996017 RepID=UPI002260F587|nr:hypothetical protein [Marinicella gelatinilytica]MCX7546083.1 hypothetical protein [Marinicella gelatinilytica]
MPADKDTNKPYYLSENQKKLTNGIIFKKDIKNYKPHNDKHLPDWFKFGLYEDLQKYKDLSEWAFEFAIRGGHLDSTEFAESSGGYTVSKNKRQLMWENGVFYDSFGNTSQRITKYLESQQQILLSRYGANKIDDANSISDSAKAWCSIFYQPDTKFIYQTFNGETLKFEFPDIESCIKYQSGKRFIDEMGASFLVNLKMPTKRIIKELEKRIDNLKNERQIRPYRTMNKAQPLKWSQALAVWDLNKYGIKPKIIQNRVIAKWHDDFPILGLDATEKPLQKMYENRYKLAQRMITTDWKKISGNIDMTP